MTPSEEQKARDAALRCQKDPAFYMRTVLGIEPSGIQEAILRSLATNPETYVASCHASGKTFIGAGAIHWWCGTRADRMAITTATSGIQSKRSIWEEMETIRDRAQRRLGPERPLGVRVLTTEAEWPELRSSAFARTVPKSQNEDAQRTMFQGTRKAGGTLVVIDEAAAIGQPIFDGAAAILTGAGDRLLGMCNPTDPAAAIARMHKAKLGTPASITMSAFESPNVKPYGVTIDDIATGRFEEKVPPREKTPFPYLANAYWIRGRWEVWTDRGMRMDDPRWVGRVLALWPSHSDDTLIPRPWIEASWQLWDEHDRSGVRELGVDVADGGADSSVCVERFGPQTRVARRETGRGSDPMTAVTMTERVLLGDHPTEASRVQALRIAVKVDANGVGSGTASRLKEKGYRVSAVKVSRTMGVDTEEMPNQRSAYFWALREKFRQAHMLVHTGACEGEWIALQPDEAVATQLSAIHWSMNDKGQIVVEPKDETKKRLSGASPDDADAIMLAHAPEDVSPVITINPDTNWVGPQWAV